MTDDAASAVPVGDGAAPSPYADPPLACDVVMKGGITSGVVYPGAILRLARRYRFRSIGGTSAGAIAAAVLAAAEHARRKGDVSGFEDVIERLPTELGGTEGGQPFMLQLFQADKPTRPLFLAIVGFMQHGRLRATFGLLAVFWRAALTAALVAAGSMLLCTVGDADVAYGVGGVSASIAILLIGAVAELLRALRRIGDNDFGLCRLGPEVGTADRPALTGWLDQRIQRAAGCDGGPPLTFADLWGVSPAAGPASADRKRFARLRTLSHDADGREVDLQMMTTDLSQGRPMRLPVVYDRHEPRLEDRAGTLLFDRVELRRYFPAAVVDHLERCAEPFSSETADKVLVLERELLGADPADGPRLLRMPIGPDLPVVVATRMSLSFPLLISAVPLWRLVFTGDAPETAHKLQRAIFSDGGITSNFPIHFFDTPLPTRPTFGLHLTTFAADETPHPDDAAACVVPPPPPSQRLPDDARDIADLKDFVGALAHAAQNWRDNAQARLPGFRDRIAHIKLAEGEGGLNLAMDPEILGWLDDRGRVAGDALSSRFSGDDPQAPAATDHWNDHRFARYRVTMAVMERLLRSYERGYRAADDAVTIPYAQRVVQGQDTLPYKFDSERRRMAAEATSQAYVDLVAGWDDDHLDDKYVPRPPATMRTVPPV